MRCNIMTQKSEHFHGSDLEKIEEIYHIPREEITSFSANVNPIGISPKLRTTLGTLTILPAILKGNIPL